MQNLKKLKILLKKGTNIEPLKRWIRRFEYLLFILVFIYLISILVEGFTTNDFSSFSNLLMVMHDFYVTLKNDKDLFLTTALFVFFFYAVVKYLVKGAIIDFTLLLFFCIVTPDQLLSFMVIVDDSLENIYNYFLNYPEVFVLLFFFVIACIIKSPYLRMKVLKSIIHTVEFFVLVLIVYYSTYYVNVFYLVFDYLNLFTYKFKYVTTGFQGFGIVYLFIVFSLKYISIINALIFHISNKIKHNKKKNIKPVLDSEFPTIGVCIPAYNEELTIAQTIFSILACDYPKNKLQIIVVSDGSTDLTVSTIKDNFDMYENSHCLMKQYGKIKHQKIKSFYHSKLFKHLYLIDKENGGKYDCLNTGLEYFEGGVDYITVIDADTILTSDSLRILAAETVKNKNVIASTGLILPTKIDNKSKLRNLFTNWQFFDYLSSFHISRAGLSLTNSMMIISGAFGLFKRDDVVEVGGYKKSLGEDIFLTLELQKNKKGTILYVPESLAYTQVPDNLDSVRKQRIRWFKGLTESLFKFRNIGKLNPRMILGYIQFFVIEWLTPLIAPYGLVLIIGNPEILKDKFVLSLVLLTLISNLIETLIAFFIECTYRKTSIKPLFHIWFQVIMSPLMTLYRNDALLEYTRKNWDKIKRY